MAVEALGILVEPRGRIVVCGGSEVAAGDLAIIVLAIDIDGNPGGDEFRGRYPESCRNRASWPDSVGVLPGRREFRQTQISRRQTRWLLALAVMDLLAGTG